MELLPFTYSLTTLELWGRELHTRYNATMNQNTKYLLLKSVLITFRIFFLLWLRHIRLLRIGNFDISGLVVQKFVYIKR